MKRTYWYAEDLGIADEPLAVSLLKYRQSKNRQRETPGTRPNLISSLTTSGKQMPIIDMDFPHRIIKSSTDGHSHLYIDIEMSKWRWFLLMTSLYYAGVIELGFYVWSVRRGANFVRLPGSYKAAGSESTKSRYGWFFALRTRGAPRDG